MKIQLIYPASRENPPLLKKAIAFLEQEEFTVKYIASKPNKSWPFAAASIEHRVQELEQALMDPSIDFLWAARGGYGCSDLLEHLDWEKIRKKSQPKYLVGFSDICVLHSAFYTKLGWQSLHAPMPATTLWHADRTHSKKLCKLIMESKSISNAIKVREISDTKNAKSIQGTLFGGCLSVLTNLIGTPFFPKNLKNHILFFEDTGESPGQVQRMWNQWKQSRSLNGVNAIIFGDFRDFEKNSNYNIKKFAQKIKQENPELRIFISKDFGHIVKNEAMGIGCATTIHHSSLAWTTKSPSSKKG